MQTRLTAALLTSIIFLIGSPVFAQQYEVIYPNGFSMIAENPLPRKVYLAQQNILEIQGRFFTKERPEQEFAVVQGSGFLEKESGYVISARHNLVEIIIDIWSRENLSYYIDKKGIPVSREYVYQFYAIVYTATARLEYPLEVAGIGPLGTHVDIMVFKPLKQIPVNGLELSENSKVGDKVYVSGFINYVIHYHQKDGRPTIVNLGSAKFNFDNEIVAILEDEKVALVGLKRVYRLLGRGEEGFSGGPGLDRNGQVVGITVEKSDFLLYAISSQDIAALIKSIK